MIVKKNWEIKIPFIAKDLNRSISENGYGNIANFLPKTSLSNIIEYIEGIKKKTGNSNFSLKEDKLKGTCVEDLLNTNIKDLMYETLKCSGI